MKFVLKLLIFVLASTAAFGDGLQRFKNVNYDDAYMDVETFILGRSCYSLRASAMSLSCNPAHLSNETKRQLGVNINLDNNITEVHGYATDLNKHSSDALVDRIANNRKPLTSNDVAAAWWQYDWFAVTVVPARLNLATVVLNPAYPQVTSHVSLQREISARAGLFVADDPHFRVGANVRFVENNQLREQFALLDAVAGVTPVEIRQSNAIYVEPALAYAFDEFWDSQVSFMLTHVRVYENHRNVPDAARPEIGWSTNPDILGKRLRTTLHFTGRPDVASTLDRFRFGGIFEFRERWAINFTLGGYELGAGLMARIESLQLGIGVKTESFRLNGEEIDQVQTVMFQGGMAF